MRVVKLVLLEVTKLTRSLCLDKFEHLHGLDSYILEVSFRCCFSRKLVIVNCFVLANDQIMK